MELNWQFAGDRPIYTQLVEQIEQAIVTGAFAPGQRLPGVRDLAQDAGVNPNTMQRALAELEARALVYSQRTSGRFVTEDTAKIAALRHQLAQNLTQGYLAGMAALGLAPGEIAQLVGQNTDPAQHPTRRHTDD